MRFFIAAAALSTSVLAADVGDSGVINGFRNGLEGTVTVKDENTLEVTGYTLEDASAPALYWWGATSDDIGSGFRINGDMVNTEAEDETLTIELLDGITASDFTYVSLWCERLDIDFGNTRLEATDGESNNNESNSESDGDSNSQEQSNDDDDGDDNNSGNAAGRTGVAGAAALVAALGFALSMA